MYQRIIELIGLVLISVAGLIAFALISYSPNDPTFLNTNTGTITNNLGVVGALIGDILFNTLGWAAWSFPPIFLVWGLRFILHIGVHRWPTRIIIIPAFTVFLSILLATYPPPTVWNNSWKMGGTIGELFVNLIIESLNFNPLSNNSWNFFIVLNLVMITLISGFFIIGCTWKEIQKLIPLIIKVIFFIFKTLKVGFKILIDLKHAYSIRKDDMPPIETDEKRSFEIKSRHKAGRKKLFTSLPIFNAQTKSVRKPNVVFDYKTNLEDNFETITSEQVDRIQSRIDKKIHQHKIEVPSDSKKSSKKNSPRKKSSIKTNQLLSNMKTLLKTSPTSKPLESSKPSVSEKTAELPISSLSSESLTPSKKSLEASSQKPSAAPAPSKSSPSLTKKSISSLLTKPISSTDPLSAKIATPNENVNLGPKSFRNKIKKSLFKKKFAKKRQLPINISTKIAQKKLSTVKKIDHNVFKRLTKESLKPSAASTEPTIPHPPQPQLKKTDQPILEFKNPTLDMLSIDKHDHQYYHISDDDLKESAHLLQNILNNYGVKGRIIAVYPGPIITSYQLKPAPELKVNRVIGLSNDIACSMSTLSARVSISVIEDQPTIDIELANAKRKTIFLREILSSQAYSNSDYIMPLALGQTVAGTSKIADLATIPHMLIAGSSGCGKSVAINAMILSLLYKLSPDECRFIMIDVKMLELSVYDGIPHLLSPVITDPKKAIKTLKWLIGETEQRYRQMSKIGVSNINSYNAHVKRAQHNGENFNRTVQTGFSQYTGEPIRETEIFIPQLIPYIVVIIDEIADLITIARKEIEAYIQYLAPMARASGIHLIIATRRPSLDSITEAIKPNIPARISFQVASKMDSRAILDQIGAEQLLDTGDMLYMVGDNKIARIHSPYISDNEVETIVNYLKRYGPPKYIDNIIYGMKDQINSDLDKILGLSNNEQNDALYDKALTLVIKERKCSASYIQRKLSIGYNKAVKIVEKMENDGIVSASNHIGKREVLLPDN